MVRRTANGFRISKEFVPKSGKNGTLWEPPKPNDAAVFTEPGAALTYLEECLGEKEHAAHEKAEGQEYKGKKWPTLSMWFPWVT